MSGQVGQRVYENPVLLSVAVNTDCSIQQCLLSKVLILYDSLCTALLERQNTVMKSRFR